MTDATDDARRRELQRRAFAPGGALTAQEAEELRMLSAARTATPAETGAGPEPASPYPEMPRTTGSAAAEASPPGTTEQNGKIEGTDPAPGIRRRPRWLVPGVAVLALLLGFGVGALVAPKNTHAAPTETAEQARIRNEILLEEELDPSSLAFAGEQHGAAVWQATRDDGQQRCLIMSLDGERSTSCASAETGTYGGALVGISLQAAGGKRASVSAVLVETTGPEPAVIIQRYDYERHESWADRFSPAQIALAEVLVDAGFDGVMLNILGEDDGIPIWTSMSAENCLAVVDPTTRGVDSDCTSEIGATSEVTLRDRVYSVVWSQHRGPLLTIIREPVSQSVAPGEITTDDGGAG